ncbi:uncharacterized protein BP5553_02380 [Venustampulla echinocandica]|uniref:Uncharacterized protein n=1 Tax=Venustampulla echinocandica TaxID=2656787 RepID=A0A370U3P5_9HELO|nr:uncharacterized protein BP5553_02380 [Venustampulla echinocandica]RDL42401.1 hypothetical protein BP5553_02380 [Venustampulla echinocandica]
MSTLSGGIGLSTASAGMRLWRTVVYFSLRGMLWLPESAGIRWGDVCEIREAVDGFFLDEARAARSRSESETLDDDGNVKGIEEILGKGNSGSIIGDVRSEKTQADEDEQELKAILACQALPEPED